MIFYDTDNKLLLKIIKKGNNERRGAVEIGCGESLGQ